MHTLKTILADWQDADIAQHALALSLGLIDSDTEFATKAKHLYWTDNPVGNMLFDILNRLAEAEILEKRTEPDYQYRWNKTFRAIK